MDGIHDLGGMHGFGPIPREEDEPVFHARWEARVLAMTVGSGPMLGTIDARRHALEKLPPARYLAMSYYEKWLARLLGGVPETEAEGAPMSAERVKEVIREGRPSGRESERKPRFAAGDGVVARDMRTVGHTRLPRYVRGRRGVIERCHGAHVFPDTSAHGLGERPQPLYSVRFVAADLWGVESRDCVYIDLWEDYLAPA